MRTGKESREKEKGRGGLPVVLQGCARAGPVASCDCRKLCRSEPLLSTREQKAIRLEDRQKKPNLASKQAIVVSSSSAHAACNTRRREPINVGSSIHLAFEQLEPGDLSFYLSGTPGFGEGGQNRWELSL